MGKYLENKAREEITESDQPKKESSRILIAVSIVIVTLIVIAIMFILTSQNGEGQDSNGDGVLDVEDAFPDDPNEWTDSDGDGVGDNSDEFPTDPTETTDSDGDGYGDNGDEFPNNPYEHVDSDGDGVGDNSDEFPYDTTQWSDRDGDGYGDNPLGNNPDAFPDDPTEWRDSDGDGVGDNADFYDSGNGKIRISIDWYQGDGTADFWTYGDPYFVILVDLDNDGIFERTYTSEVFTDDETLNNPYHVTIDAPDSLKVLRFQIQVFDSDLDGSEIIDYNPSAGYTGYTHTVHAPFCGSWDYDGSDDLLDEIDCELRYSISVVG